MNKYTFIFEYNKGTYISQIAAEQLEIAVMEWAIKAIIPNISDLERTQLINEIQLEEEKPTAIESVDNVWCMFLRVGKKSHLLNIIATV